MLVDVALNDDNFVFDITGVIELPKGKLKFGDPGVFRCLSEPRSEL
jgi:hypothetical protein